MHRSHPQSPANARPRRRTGRLVAAAAGAAIAAAALTVAGSSPAHAAIPGDRQSPTVVLAAAQALAKHDEAVAMRTIRGRYDQAAAYRVGVTRLEYDALRNRTATLTARELGVDPAAMRRAWARADEAHQVAVLAALSQLGVAYQTNTSEQGVGFDCSGLTTFAWGRAGTELYRQSGTQIEQAAPRDLATAVAGDLVQYPGHVMMYLGVNDAIVHSANHESDVEIASIPSGHSVRFGDPTG